MPSRQVIRYKIPHHSSSDSGSSAPAPVLVLARTGFIIRNLLLGKFAEAVTAHRPLVVTVPNPTDPRLLRVLGGQPIRLVEHFSEPPAADSRCAHVFSWHAFMYRFKEAEKGTHSLETQTRLFESKHGWRGRTRIALLHAVGHCLKHARLLPVVEDRYLAAIGRHPLTQQWRALIEQVQPCAVVSTMLTHCALSEPSADLPAVLAAHQLGIPVGTLVQSWDNLSSKTSVLPPWLDWYWTWSETMTRELLALNPRIRAEKVAVVGSPQFDFHLAPELLEDRATYCRRLGLDPSQPYIVIGTGTRKWLPNEPAGVVQIVDALSRRVPHCQVLIRLHPKDDGRRWREHAEFFARHRTVLHHTSPPTHMDNGGFVPPTDFFRDQINCLKHAAVVLNTASTLTVDAAILDRPVICLGYDAQRDPRFPNGRALEYSQSNHYRTLVETGGVRVVRALEECLAAIEHYLRHPECDREGRDKIVRCVTARVGGAGERLAEEVLSLADCCNSVKA